MTVKVNAAWAEGCMFWFTKKKDFIFELLYFWFTWPVIWKHLDRLEFFWNRTCTVSPGYFDKFCHCHSLYLLERSVKKEKKLFSNKASARFQDSVHIRHNNRIKGFNSHNFNNCSKQKDTVKNILVLIVIFCIWLVTGFWHLLNLSWLFNLFKHWKWSVGLK